LRAGSNDFVIVEAFEFREAVEEGEYFFAGWAVPMFTHEDISFAPSFRILVIHVLTINEHDDVGILFDSATLAEIGKHRNGGVSELPPNASLAQARRAVL